MRAVRFFSYCVQAVRIGLELRIEALQAVHSADPQKSIEDARHELDKIDGPQKCSDDEAREGLQALRARLGGHF